jgi:signal transduction histidine kinase
VSEALTPTRAANAAAGTQTSCVLLTVITVLLALAADDPRTGALLRPLYFALLFGFFHGVGRREPRLARLPFRLVQSGFLVLTLGFTVSATIHLDTLPLEPELRGPLLDQLERGAVFLLALSLISYGILLWIPELVQSQRILRENFQLARGQLRQSESARERIELRLVEADRLRAVGEIAAGAAHDLRNPLAIVKAAAESIAPTGEADEFVDVIRRNVDRAERTIQSLLDLGKPAELAITDVALDAMLDETLALVRVEARRREVRFEQIGRVGLAVRADRKLFVQALLNLVLNALQASPPGSTVRISRHELHAGGASFAAVVVADRGSGIDAETAKKLFTPFYTTKSSGTGLGLLSSRRILAELGGRIGLRPRRRGGAFATVILPLVSAPVGSPR